MTAFFHANSMTQEEEFEFAVSIHKYNMYVKKYGKGVATVAFADTEFEPTLKLFCSSTLTVFSPEANVEALRKAAKKVPQLILMAGIVDGQLLSRNEFLEYGKMNLTGARAQLVHTLRTAGGANLNRQFNHHQSTLVSRLRQIADGGVATQQNDTQEANNEEVKPE